MSRLLYTVTLLVVVSTTRCEILDDIRHAVRQSYDTTVSVDENIQAIHALLCPQSVLCPQGDMSRESYTDRIDEVLAYPTGVKIYPEHNTSLLDARLLLFNLTTGLNGCCKYCSCSPGCADRQNCCPAMPTSDGDKRSLGARQECAAGSIRKMVFNDYLFGRDFYGQSYFMVASCESAFNISSSDETKKKCEYPDLQFPDHITPVYSNITGITYKNKYCSVCNGQHDTIPWSLEIVSLNKDISYLSSPQELYNFVISRLSRIDILLIPPRELAPQVEENLCVFTPSNPISCSDDYASTAAEVGDFIEAACNRYEQFYLTQRWMFRNVFCSLCLLSQRGQSTCYDWGDRTHREVFSAILVHNGAPDSASARERPNRCECQEYYDSARDVCRQIRCAPGDAYVKCKCTSYLKYIAGVWNAIHLEIASSSGRMGDVILNRRGQFLTSMYSKLKLELSLGSRRLILNTASIFQISPNFKNQSRFHIIAVVKVSHASDTKRAARVLLEGLRNDGIAIDILGIAAQVKLGTILNLSLDMVDAKAVLTFPENTTVKAIVHVDDFKLHKAFYSNHLRKLMYCDNIQLHNDESERILNMDMVAGYTHSQLGYIYNHKDSSMCFGDFKTVFGRSDARLVNVRLVCFVCFTLLLLQSEI